MPLTPSEAAQERLKRLPADAEVKKALKPGTQLTESALKSVSSKILPNGWPASAKNKLTFTGELLSNELAKAFYSNDFGSIDDNQRYFVLVLVSVFTQDGLPVGNMNGYTLTLKSDGTYDAEKAGSKTENAPLKLDQPKSLTMKAREDLSDDIASMKSLSLYDVLNNWDEDTSFAGRKALLNDNPRLVTIFNEKADGKFDSAKIDPSNIAGSYKGTETQNELLKQAYLKWRLEGAPEGEEAAEAAPPAEEEEPEAPAEEGASAGETEPKLEESGEDVLTSELIADLHEEFPDGLNEEALENLNKRHFDKFDETIVAQLSELSGAPVVHVDNLRKIGMELRDFGVTKWEEPLDDPHFCLYNYLFLLGEGEYAVPLALPLKIYSDEYAESIGKSASEKLGISDENLIWSIYDYLCAKDLMNSLEDGRLQNAIDANEGAIKAAVQKSLQMKVAHELSQELGEDTEADIFRNMDIAALNGEIFRLRQAVKKMKQKEELDAYGHNELGLEENLSEVTLERLGEMQLALQEEINAELGAAFDALGNFYTYTAFEKGPNENTYYIHYEDALGREQRLLVDVGALNDEKRTEAEHMESLLRDLNDTDEAYAVLDYVTLLHAKDGLLADANNLIEETKERTIYKAYDRIKSRGESEEVAPEEADEGLNRASEPDQVEVFESAPNFTQETASVSTTNIDLNSITTAEQFDAATKSLRENYNTLKANRETLVGSIQSNLKSYKSMQDGLKELYESPGSPVSRIEIKVKDRVELYKMISSQLAQLSQLDADLDSLGDQATQLAGHSERFTDLGPSDQSKLHGAIRSLDYIQSSVDSIQKGRNLEKSGYSGNGFEPNGNAKTNRESVYGLVDLSSSERKDRLRAELDRKLDKQGYELMSLWVVNGKAVLIVQNKEGELISITAETEAAKETLLNDRQAGSVEGAALVDLTMMDSMNNRRLIGAVLNANWNQSQHIEVKGDKEYEVAVAEVRQLSQKMQARADNSQWTGVDRAYVEMMEICEANNITVKEDTHWLGAKAARARGDIASFIERAEKAPGIDEAQATLEYILDTYGKVSIKYEGKKNEMESIDFGPTGAIAGGIDPSARNAASFAKKQLRETGEFEGYLPIGTYYYRAGFMESYTLEVKEEGVAIPVKSGAALDDSN